MKVTNLLTNFDINDKMIMTLDKYGKRKASPRRDREKITQAKANKTQSSKNITTKFGKWMKKPNKKNEVKKSRNRKNMSFEAFTNSKSNLTDPKIPRTTMGKIISKSSDKKPLNTNRIEKSKLFSSNNQEVKKNLFSSRKNTQNINAVSRIQSVSQKGSTSRRSKLKQYTSSTVNRIKNEKARKASGKSLEKWPRVSSKLHHSKQKSNRSILNSQGIKNEVIVKRSSKTSINQNIGSGSSRSIGGFPRNSNYKMVTNNAFPGMKPPSVGLFNNNIFSGSNYFNTRGNGFW